MTDKNVALFGDSLPATPTSALRALGAARNQGTELFMKFVKADGFMFGPEQIPVEPDELWAVNPDSFEVGVIGWKDGQVVDEIMYPIASGKRVDRSELEVIPASANPDQTNGWQDQLSIRLHQIEEGVDVVYKTSTHGGKTAISELAEACADQAEKDEDYRVPVVTLHTDWYKHKTRGKVYVPQIKVEYWVDINGDQPAKKRRNLTG
jgi:hypothetical protein